MKAANLILTSLVASLAWAYPKYPLGFFAKVDGAWRPLVGTFSRVHGVEMEILSYGNAYPIPTNFSLQGGYAVTGNTHDPAHLGSHGGMLGFGHEIPKTELKFDAEMKVLDVQFHSCKILSNLLYEIFVGEIDVPGAECSEVEIYFLPYDRRTGAAVTSIKC